MQGGRYAVLEHRPALIGELVAHGARALRVKHRRMVLDFVAVRTGDGVLMALATAAGIEQRTETDLRRERAVEHGASAIESRALRRREAGQRIPGLRLVTRRRANHREGDPVPGHGLESTPASMRPTRSIV